MEKTEQQKAAEEILKIANNKLQVQIGQLSMNLASAEAECDYMVHQYNNLKKKYKELENKLPKKAK
jgi:predicted nuclease with TOPRIM domain